MLRLTPWDFATSAAEAPGTSDSLTISSFSVRERHRCSVLSAIGCPSELDRHAREDLAAERVVHLRIRVAVSEGRAHHAGRVADRRRLIRQIFSTYAQRVFLLHIPRTTK